MKHYGTILTGKQNQPNLKQKHKKCVIIVRFIVYPRQYFEEIHRKIDCSKKTIYTLHVYNNHNGYNL